MPNATEMVQLSVSEAACLEAVKDGLDGKTKIAIETKKDLKTVARVLEKLSRARLIGRVGIRHWYPTKHGQNCAVNVVPDPERGEFREEILRAMKKHTPQDYQRMVMEYYKELVK